MAVVIWRILYFVYLGWCCTLIYKTFHPSARSPYRVVEDTRQGIRQRIRNIHTRNSPGRTEKLIKSLRDHQAESFGKKKSAQPSPKAHAKVDKLVSQCVGELVHLQAYLEQLVEVEDYEAAAQVRDHIEEVTAAMASLYIEELNLRSNLL